MSHEFFQKSINAIVNQQVQADLSAKNIITLGELIARLEPIERERPEAVMQIDEPGRVGGSNPVRMDSYRGYYEQLAVVPGSEPCTARMFLEMLRGADGAMYYGYKGGEYTMRRSTFVWLSEYGTASGVGIVGLEPRGDCIVIRTEVIDAWAR